MPAPADRHGAQAGDVAPNRQRAQTDLMVGMRLAEMAPVVPCDVPVGDRLGIFPHEGDQQRLGEIIAVN